jgi:uncharacterized protein YkwD
MSRTKASIIVTAILLTSAVSCGRGTGSVPAQKILDLINQKRVEAGCPAVTGDDHLLSAADRHAIDMRDNNAHLQPGTDGHTGSDGSRPEQRIKDAGFVPLSRSGEIIYWSSSPSSAEANVNWWMNSPTHRAIMLDCRFTHAGVGLFYPGGTQWYSVVDFGTH